MNVTPDLADYISILERQVAWMTWNTRWKQAIRYPVNMINPDTDEWEEYKEFAPCCDEKYISSMYYKFGYNELQIGNALLNIMSRLEQRYEIDFAELEEQYRNRYTEDDGD